MIRLLREEVRRFRLRRSIRYASAVALLALLLIPLATFLGHSGAAPPGPGSAEYSEAIDQCRANGIPEADEASIEAYCTSFALPPDERFCPLDLVVEQGRCLSNGATSIDQLVKGESLAPSPAIPGAVDDDETTFGAPGANGTIASLGLVIALIAIGLGSTFIGAEFRWGTIETALIAEPRRTRLWLGRFIAGALGIATVTAFIIAAVIAAYLPTLHWRSRPDMQLDGYWPALAGVAWRTVAAAVVMGLIAMAVSSITRSTAGGVIGVLGTILVSLLLTATVSPSLAPWDPALNLSSVISGADVTAVRSVTADPQFGGGVYSVMVRHHGPAGSWLFLLGIAVVTLALALVASRRDVGSAS